MVGCWWILASTLKTSTGISISLAALRVRVTSISVLNDHPSDWTALFVSTKVDWNHYLNKSFTEQCAIGFGIRGNRHFGQFY